MIQLRIKNESELYSPYDPSQTVINRDVYNYLKSFFTESEGRTHQHDTLQIITDTPINEERVKQTIIAAVKKDQTEIDRQISLNHKRAVEGFVIGILLSVAGFGLAVILNQIILEIISFIGTMSVREAVVIYTKLNPDIRRVRRLLDPLTDLKMEVVIAE